MRSKDDPPAGGQGRSHGGKLLPIGAVEIVSGKNDKLTLGRMRLAPIADFARTSLHAFIAANTAPGSNVKTDRLAAYLGPPDVTHQPHIVGAMGAGARWLAPALIAFALGLLLSHRWPLVLS